jgi:hypothetical protein
MNWKRHANGFQALGFGLADVGFCLRTLCHSQGKALFCAVKSMLITQVWERLFGAPRNT